MNVFVIVIVVVRIIRRMIMRIEGYYVIFLNFYWVSGKFGILGNWGWEIWDEGVIGEGWGMDGEGGGVGIKFMEFCGITIWYLLKTAVI